jgi:hypothetical protein
MTNSKPASLTASFLTRKSQLGSARAAPSVSLSSIEPVPSSEPASVLTLPLSSLERVGSLNRGLKIAHPVEAESQETDGKRVRLSLRLDPQRHLRLKVLATHESKTLQGILVEALDSYFQGFDLAEVDRLCRSSSKGKRAAKRPARRRGRARG